VNQSKGDKGPEAWKPPLSMLIAMGNDDAILTVNSQLLLHVREDVDQGEERVLAYGYELGEERAD
jgi:hypothetical protein